VVRREGRRREGNFRGFGLLLELVEHVLDGGGDAFRLFFGLLDGVGEFIAEVGLGSGGKAFLVGQGRGVWREEMGELLLVEAVVLDGFELVESAGVGTFGGGTVAVEEGGSFFDVGVVGKEGVGSGLFVELGVGDGEIAETPGGVDELVEGIKFDGAFGFEVGGVFGEEGIVVFALFGGVEDDAGGCEAVDAAVLGGAGFALGGDGAVGLGSVDASGVAVCRADGGHSVVL